jgi:hypothetical protein
MLAPPYRRFPQWMSYATPIAVGVGSAIAAVVVVTSA